MTTPFTIPDPLTDEEHAVIADMITNRIHGDPEHAAEWKAMRARHKTATLDRADFLALESQFEAHNLWVGPYSVLDDSIRAKLTEMAGE